MSGRPYLSIRESMPPANSIRVNYVREFTKLSLWYARKRLVEGTSDFSDAINSRVNIYRNTRLYDGKRHPSDGYTSPEWTRILEQLRGVFGRYRDDGSTHQLEREGLELLWPHLWVERHSPPSLEGRPYECWAYDYSSDCLNIHISNVYQPRSPLSDMLVPFAASLIRLLRDSQLRRPGITMVGCGSWLNSMPPFLSLFPACWRESSGLAREVGYTMGYWGQFTDRRGGFHARNGALLRETNEFPYPSLYCESTIEAVLTHLEAYFPAVLSSFR